jgi:DNA-binding NarL/FixJ family response regulator
MQPTTRRILIVEDFEPIRLQLQCIIQQHPDWQVIDAAADGMEAVQKAIELQPDVVLLDIGLPKLNGIEAARQIQSLSSALKILFVSQERSADIVGAVLSAGAAGYVVKEDVGHELIHAVTTVLAGGRYVGRRFAGCDFAEGCLAKTRRDLAPESSLLATAD